MEPESGYSARMLRTLLENARGGVTLALIVINIVVCFIPIFLAAIIRFIIPLKSFRHQIAKFLIACAETWISINGIILRTMTPFNVRVIGDAKLIRDDWYLVVSNHQSWIDVLALQFVFNRQVPFFKFFIKQSLIWVPFLGIAWWALDMPFMKRYSKSYLAKHPDKRGQDLETTRIACEKFRHVPTSVINFVEGTRATPAKIAARESKYRHLLRARSGGIAFALGAMGDILKRLLDVTIHYPYESYRFWDLCCGRIGEIVMHARVLDIPDDIVRGDYANDSKHRAYFHRWLDELWAEKDALLADLHQQFPRQDVSRSVAG